MHLCRLNSTIKIAIEHWPQSIRASSCFVIKDLESIDFGLRIATVAFAYAEFTNSIVHLALPVFMAACFTTIDHLVEALVRPMAAQQTSAYLNSSSVVASYHQPDYFGPIARSSIACLNLS
jgi:hypothetical protein